MKNNDIYLILQNIKEIQKLINKITDTMENGIDIYDQKILEIGENIVTIWGQLEDYKANLTAILQAKNSHKL